MRPTAQRFLLLRASEYATTTSSSRASDNVAIDVHTGQRRQPLILKKVNGFSLRLEPPTYGCLLSGIGGKVSLKLLTLIVYFYES